MKKILIISFAILTAFSSAVIVWNIYKPTEKTNHTGPGHPGYYEQIRLMKQNEAGEIPVGLRNTWYRHDALFKKAGNLLNVAEWGPTNVGGRTRALAIDLTNNSRILAGSVSGGLWISEDRGKTWSLRDDHALSLAVTCITQSPFDKNVFYYGTGEAIGNSAGIDGNGVFKSEDGGITFTQLPATNNVNFSMIWDVKHSLTDSNTLFVATNDKGLWKSTDAGKTFSRIFNTGSRIHEIEVFRDTTLMCAIAGLGIFKMHEDSTWQLKLSGGLPASSYGRISLTYCKAHPDTMYTQFMNSSGTAHVGIYRSNNRGKTWTALTNPSSIVNYSWAWYCLDLAVHPSNADWLTSISVSAGFSKDGGKTWNELEGSHADYHTTQFFPGENNFLIGNDGGIYEYNTLTAGSTFLDRKAGYNVTQFYTGSFFPTGQDLIGGTQDNGTRMTKSQNSNFSRILGGDGSYCAIDQQNAATVYGSSQNGVLRRADASDLSQWTDIDNTILGSGEQVWFINPFDINPIDGYQIYFPTKQRLWRSSDRGNNWSEVTNKLVGGIYSLAITPQVNPTVYIGGQSGLFYRIKNAQTASPGSEVMLTTLPPAAAKGGFIGNIEINPKNESTLYLAMNNISTNPRIWKVWNADSDAPTWVNISSNLPSQLPVNWIEVDALDTNIMAAATDFGLYTSVNGGASWEKEMSIPNVTIPMIKLRKNDRQLFIFTHGRGVWKATMPQKPVGLTGVNATSQVFIFPNPVKNLLHIKCSDVISEIKILNLNGAEVQNIKFSDQIDLTELPEGIYLIRVCLEGGKSILNKFVKN